VKSKKSASSLSDGSSSFLIKDGELTFLSEKKQTKFRIKILKNNDETPGDDELALVLVFAWPKKYPAVVPELELESEQNKRIKSNDREELLKTLNQEASTMLGEPMTLTLLEIAREKLQDIEAQAVGSLWSEVGQSEDSLKEKTVTKKAPKEVKEKLTKSQKRRAQKHIDYTTGGERPRGWNWVDLISHLSKTGGVDD